MRILIGNNHHAGPGGVEVMFDMTVDILRRHGHHVVTIVRDNATLQTFRSKVTAFGSAMYSWAAKREVAQLVRAHHCDAAIFFNLYPQLSTSAIDACWEAGVPVLLSVNDYKFVCPTGQHLRNGRVCERCLHRGRELHCVVTNCRNSWPISVSYAIRNVLARWRGTLTSRVAAYVVPTRFVGQRLTMAGFPRERIVVIPTSFDLAATPQRVGDGAYVAYAGRISPEKGLPVLIEAARRTGYPTRIAGDPSPMPALALRLPPNVTLLGRLPRAQLPAFYSGARFVVVPSVFYEPFAIVNVEAKACGVPAVASEIGGLPEVIEHERTGLLFPAGDVDALAAAMTRLWENPALCNRLGAAARAAWETVYAPRAYYEALLRTLQSAVAEAPARTRTPSPGWPIPSRHRR